MDIVLFGVGQHTDKFISIIRYFGGNVIYLADNDERKSGQVFWGMQVVLPRSMLAVDCKIIVSCIHWKEIEVQLSEMGIKDRLISLSSFLKLSGGSREWTSADCTICMDLCSKAKWGGAENWNILLTNALAAKRDKIDMARFQQEYTFAKIVEYYQERLPVVFVNSFYGENFFAVMAVKRMYPDKVRIINVIHNDREAHYQLAVLFDDWIDQYLCVSSKIKETLVKEYGIPEKRVSFFHQPIELANNLRRALHPAGPIRLGMASRLVAEQKRCDLIPKLIRYLEDDGVDYVMSIAGDGELSETIHNYVKDNNLMGKVHILGYLSGEEMADFWKEQDIYINISEYEGTSLSMLEAMENGCVPLVTNVSGAGDYICDGGSGFLFDIGDLRHIAERVKLLEADRRKLFEMGIAARQEVCSKCNVADYADKLVRMVEDMP